MSDWLNAITKLRRDGVQPVPNGYLTKDEATKALGSSPGNVSRLLRDLINAGVVERKMFRRVAADGRVLNLPHFRLRKRK